MTWTLKSVTIRANTNAQLPQLARLVRSVDFVFSNLDTNGVEVDTLAYTEPNVSDVSPAGLATLARNQLRQLQAISDAPFPLGAVSDLTAITTLIAAPPSLPPLVVAGIRAAADFTQSNDAIALALNTADQPNPVAVAPTINPPMSALALLGGLSDASRANIAENANAAAIDDAIRRQDNAAVGAWAAMMLAAGKVTPAEHDAVVAAIAPVADPTWTAEVSRASLIVGRPLTPGDIAEVRALSVGA